ncbi:hypothetical protein GCM10007084_12770 [Parabacteroides faecis]|nr:hypothetical protein GCM10007084_12770 [Parabacteroides faecis]
MWHEQYADKPKCKPENCFHNPYPTVLLHAKVANVRLIKAMKRLNVFIFNMFALNYHASFYVG